MKTQSLRSGLLQWTLLLAIIGMFAVLALPSVVQAQDAAAPVSTGPATLDADTGEIVAPAAAESAVSIVQALTAVVVPVIVFGVRKLVPALPKLWLPVIAAGLGVIAEAISAFASGHDSNLWLGVVLGLAGVGVREATKQLKEAVVTPAPAQ